MEIHIFSGPVSISNLDMGPMNRRTTIYRLFLPWLLLASLCACSRYIEGEVYLDKNSNNIKDLGEPAIYGVQYSVTQNGSTVNSGVTDPDGHFSVPLESAKIDVNYCVSVNSQGELVFPQAPKASKALEASVDEDEDEDEDEGDDCKKMPNGQPDCTDSDCCDDALCDDAEACQAEETPEAEEDKDACPEKSDGQPNCADSRCADEPACDTYTVKSMQACDKTKTTELVMKLDVPVAVDYSTRLGKIEKSEKTVQVGEIVGLEFVFPKSCTFQPFILSKSLEVSIGNAFDPMTREIFLAKAVAERPSQLFYNDTPRFGHDELITYLLPVTVVAGQDQEIQIQPKLNCPDGKEVSSNLQVLYIGSAPGGSETKAYELTSEISGGCPELDESGVLSIWIQDTAGQGIAESSYSVAVSGAGSHLAFEDLPEFCHYQNSAVECAIEASPLLSKLGLAFNFTVSESIPKPANLVFTPKLKVDGAEIDGAPLSCSYP